jgi:hypothetical protein
MCFISVKSGRYRGPTQASIAATRAVADMQKGGGRGVVVKIRKQISQK